jgi:hypothetical protein
MYTKGDGLWRSQDPLQQPAPPMPQLCVGPTMEKSIPRVVLQARPALLEVGSITAVQPVCLFFLSPFISSNTKIAADCNTAVTNFPACANMTWNMFINNGEGGYFCCEPGQIGVNPSSGGGICESSDQVVPTSLLATIVSQVGAPTPTPTGTSATIATTTGGSPLETNPTAQNTPQPTGGINSTISNMSLAVKIAIGVGCAVFVFLVVCGGNLIRRRTYVRANTYEYDTTYNAGYSAYRPGYVNPMRQDNGNHVTVNVVHGDQTT